MHTLKAKDLLRCDTIHTLKGKGKGKVILITGLCGLEGG